MRSLSMIGSNKVRPLIQQCQALLDNNPGGNPTIVLKIGKFHTPSIPGKVISESVCCKQMEFDAKDVLDLLTGKSDKQPLHTL